MNRAAKASRQGEVERALRDHAPALLKYFLRRVEDREDAADLVSETMLTAWRRGDRMPGDADEARMWMYGIAANVLRNARRSRRRRSALAERLRDDLATEARGADEPEMRLDVQRALGALPERDRELVRLVHWDGLSLAQAAAHLGWNASSTRTRYARLRARLAELLAVDDTIAPDAAAADEPEGSTDPVGERLELR